MVLSGEPLLRNSCNCMLLMSIWLTELCVLNLKSFAVDQLGKSHTNSVCYLHEQSNTDTPPSLPGAVLQHEGTSFRDVRSYRGRQNPQCQESCV